MPNHTLATAGRVEGMSAPPEPRFVGQLFTLTQQLPSSRYISRLSMNGRLTVFIMQTSAQTSPIPCFRGAIMAR